MSNITYKEIVDFLKETTGDHNWYLNNKVGLPIAHRYMSPVIVQRQVTEAVKKLQKMKDEEHAGQLAHAARQSAKAGKSHFTLGGKTFPVTAKVAEEAEQVDEGVKGALVGGAIGGLATKSARGAYAGAKIGSAVQNLASKAKQNEEAEQMDEVLKPSMGAAAYIHDFVHSTDPKFAGKSKKDRIKQALGAYYAARRAMKEEAEQVEEAKHTHTVHFNPRENPLGLTSLPVSAKSDDEAREKGIAKSKAIAKHQGDDPSLYKVTHVQKIKEDAEQIDEASSHIAHLKPKDDAPEHLRDLFDLPVNSADHKEAHKKFTKVFGNSIAKHYEVVHVKPRQVDESILGAAALGLAGGAIAGRYIGKHLAPKILKHMEKKSKISIAKRQAELHADDAAQHVAKSKESNRSKRSQNYHKKEAIVAMRMAHNHLNKYAELTGKKVDESVVIENNNDLEAALSEARFGRAIDPSKLSKAAQARLAARAGVKKATEKKPETAAPAEKTPEKASSVHSVRALNAARQAAYYAKGGREAFGVGGGPSRASPIEKALKSVKSVGSKTIGSSPLDKTVQQMAKKSVAEELKVGEDDEPSSGKKKLKKKIRNYLGNKRGLTKTRTAKAHKIEIDPTLEDAKT